MKIIHTSDIHLASKLTARLPSSKVASRRKEITESFFRMCREGMNLGASAMIIAGDLFDSEKITRKELDSALAIIERAESIAFFYLPGNHERNLLLSSGEAIPKNLFIFGAEWTYFKLGNITVAGRSETSPDMFDTLTLSAGDKNVVVLHGELREKSREGGVIGLRDAEGKNIDYLALGHYHTYSSGAIDKRGTYAYSGAPEGRGFDETGELGFSLVSITESSVMHKFIPFAKRKLVIKNVDISGAMRTHDVEALIREALKDEPGENLVRINFVGERELELRCDKDFLKRSFSDKFYYFEIKDSSKLLTRTEDYRYDKSLKGEFIRLCLADETLADEEKEKIIHCGLSALMGEAFDE
ncbi:MAG: metallophosphoesterase [Clostridia bacterium]|nr:metallophosphoesterase [Clostridia bacterium]